MTDVGKNAKRMGKVSPYMAKRPYPEKEKVTPGVVKRPKDRPWGFVYEYQKRWWAGDGEKVWVEESRWYGTEKGRDQALKVFERQIKDRGWYRLPKKAEEV